MEKMLIFVGGPRTGKSTKAREITEGKNTVWINGRSLKYALNYPFLLEHVTEETEYIIFDDCIENINQLATSLFPERLTINRHRRPTIVINRPKIIIITSEVDYKFDTSASFLRRFDIIHFLPSAELTQQKMIMTREHPDWKMFTNRLGHKEGCNFHEKIKGDPKSITFSCSHSSERPFAVAILNKMKIFDVPKTLEYFDKNGGHCDCEILFNIDL